MSERDEGNVNDQLENLFAARRMAEAPVLSRHEFNQKYLYPTEPKAKPKKLLWPWYAGAATAFATAAFAVLFLFKTPKAEVIAAGNETLSRDIANIGRVYLSGSELHIAPHGDGPVNIRMRGGRALFIFARSAKVRNLAVENGPTLTITGTVVYVDIPGGFTSVLEGSTLLGDARALKAGEYYDHKALKILQNTEAIHTAAARLADVSAYLPRKIEKKSPAIPTEADKLFEKYGNVQLVTLNSDDKIYAAYALDPDTQKNRLYSLGGPLFIGEKDIRSIRKIR